MAEILAAMTFVFSPKGFQPGMNSCRAWQERTQGGLLPGDATGEPHDSAEGLIIHSLAVLVSASFSAWDAFRQHLKSRQGAHPG